jgi:hypothetical protein
MQNAQQREHQTEVGRSVERQADRQAIGLAVVRRSEYLTGRQKRSHCLAGKRCSSYGNTTAHWSGAAPEAAQQIIFSRSSAALAEKEESSRGNHSQCSGWWEVRIMGNIHLPNLLVKVLINKN